MSSEQRAIIGNFPKPPKHPVSNGWQPPLGVFRAGIVASGNPHRLPPRTCPFRLSFGNPTSLVPRGRPYRREFPMRQHPNAIASAAASRKGLETQIGHCRYCIVFLSLSPAGNDGSKFRTSRSGFDNLGERIHGNAQSKSRLSRLEFPRPASEAFSFKGTSAFASVA